VMASLALAAGVVLQLAHDYFGRDQRIDPVVEKINALLPQSQCGQCGYSGCRPYAESVAGGESIDKCPPGGRDLVRSLASLLNRPLPEQALAAEPDSQVAFVLEESCIGCSRCLPACPVDAIVGAFNQMHTVIADDCTGCELCVHECPVDCIVLLEKPEKAGRPEKRPAEDLSKEETLQPCIRCGRCADVCPSGLLPQQLYSYSQQEDWAGLSRFQLKACIECGQCNQVCPSQLPLVQQFRQAKKGVSRQAEGRRNARRWEGRFQQRRERIRLQDHTQAVRRKERLKKFKSRINSTD